MAEPEDMSVPLLGEMRAEIAKRFDRTDGRLDGVDGRLPKIEDAQKSFRQALTTDTLMTPLLTGEFEQRIGSLEKQVRELQGRA